MAYLRPAILTALTMIVSTGCVDRTPVESSSPENQEVAESVSGGQNLSATGGLEELLLAPADAQAFPVVTGSFVTGSLQVSSDRTVSAFAVQIGNYAGTADGLVAVELCQAAKCAGGTKALSGSVDNEYFEIPLDSGLELSAGPSLTYRITKVDGVNPVALWLYTPTDAVSAVQINDGTSMNAAPRLALRF